MATQAIHGFVLWAVPRFRRSDGTVKTSPEPARGVEARDPAGPGRDHAAMTLNDAVALENPDLSACLNFYRSAYH
jgi:hypothetical protein